jgi:hypothetical protein
VDPPTIELNNVDLKEAGDSVSTTNGAAAKWSANGAGSSGAAVIATSTNDDDSHDEHEHVINLSFSF